MDFLAFLVDGLWKKMVEYVYGKSPEHPWGIPVMFGIFLA